MNKLVYETSGFRRGPAMARATCNYIREYQQTAQYKSPVRMKKDEHATFMLAQEHVEALNKIAKTFELLALNLERTFDSVDFANEARNMHTPRIHWQDGGARRPSRVSTIKLNWHTMIKDAEKVEDILNSLRRIGGFDAVVQRLRYLDTATKEEGRAIEFQSLQKFALFMRDYPQLKTPEIGITPRGLVQSVWRMPEHGTVAMNFLPSGEIMFAMILYRRTPGTRTHKINGVMPPHRVMQHVKEFIDKVDA